MQFEMNRTWSQAVALVRGNFQLLSIIAGVFVLLPALFIYSAFPQVLTMSGFGADPKTVNAELAALFPRLALYGAIAFLLQIAGYLTMIALMGGSRPTVGESIVRGAKAVPTVIAAIILLAVATIVLGLALGLIVGLLGAMLMALAGASGGVVAGLVALALYIALIVIVAYAFARFSPLLPVIVLEFRYNPVSALLRAWRLTKPRGWPILGFFALLFVVYIVISAVFMMVVSAFTTVAAGSTGGAATFIIGLFAGLLAAAVTMLLSAILVSIHQQLAGDSPTALAETFE